MSQPFADGLGEVLAAPIGELIAELGRGVAEAQNAMDAATIASVQALATASEADGDPLALLRRVGYQPTWYRIPEVEAEISMALTVTGSTVTPGDSGGRRGTRLYAVPLDASYTNRFGYELKAASTIRFRIVPVPPSPMAERLRAAPALAGLTFADARERLGTMDIPWRLAAGLTSVSDMAVVTSQTPEPGALLGPDESIVLHFNNG